MPMRTRPQILLLVAALALPASLPARADLVVVAHPKSGVTRLSRAEVINIFLGRLRQLPSGAAASPIDLPSHFAERDNFYRKLVNKEPAEIASYWSRLVFSGGTQPPYPARDNDDVLAHVARDTGAIAYLDRSRVDGRARIVFEFTD